jgi:1-deoxy-D-xylulose-5-phosphate reductoisomerase
MKSISILGSTGSIGTSTLSVIDALGDQFAVSALAAGRDIDKLADQIARYRPQLASVANESDIPKLKARLQARDVTRLPEIMHGEAGLVAVAAIDNAEVVVSATVGAVGFLPTYRALALGRRVCLANKETLVMAGELMTRAAKESGAELLPVDSEHNALHQCMRGEQVREVKRLILTASGGPFRQTSLAEMREATVEQALAHPTWRMGPKITIDSATLANKGLELIEAHFLFGLPYDRIEVVLQPTSVVHALVRFRDGASLAHLGYPDMRAPIAFALTYPERAATTVPPLDLSQGLVLEFEPPDLETFPLLALARRAGEQGSTYPCAFNAANEVAVAAFLDGRLPFLGIAATVEETMAEVEGAPARHLDDLVEADRTARRLAERALAVT